MNLTLYLTPETEAKLKERASLTGKNPEVVAIEAIQEQLSVAAEPGEMLSAKSRLAEFRDWLSSMPGGNPRADFSRDSIYGNRGE